MPSTFPNLESAREELINWIVNLRQEEWIMRLWQIKQKVEKSPSKQLKPQRTFGGGKGVFTYISPDFDAPLNDFKDYMP